MLNTDLWVWQTELSSSVFGAVRELALEMGSLTQALSTRCGQEIRVDVISEGIITIEGTRKTAWVREVLLKCQDRDVLYATSKIVFFDQHEQDNFIGNMHPFSELQRLNVRPLGYWIAEQQELTRSDFEFMSLDNTLLDTQSSLLTQHVLKHGQSLSPLVARRSFLHKQTSSLELVEVFVSSMC